jgi:hypothetical protein
MGIHVVTVKTEQVTARRAVAATSVSLRGYTKACFGEDAEMSARGRVRSRVIRVIRGSLWFDN